ITAWHMSFPIVWALKINRVPRFAGDWNLARMEHHSTGRQCTLQLGRPYGVLKQAGNRHGTCPTRHGGNPSGKPAYLIELDIAANACCGAADANIEYRRAWLDTIRSDQAGEAGRSHHDIRFTRDARNIRGPRMRQRYRRVHA